MGTRLQLGAWLCGLALGITLCVPAVWAQRPHKDRPARPAAQPRQAERPRSREAQPSRRNDRPPNAGRSAMRENRPVAPPPNPQERLRNMTPQERQGLAQNQERLRSLPPAQRQQLRERAQVWQRMTPVQKDHVRNQVLPKWKQMPPDRRQAVQQRLRVLQNMPESARNRRLNDPKFTQGMNEEDKATLRDLSHLHVGGAPEPPE